MYLDNQTPLEVELTGAAVREGHEAAVVVAKATFDLPRESGGECLFSERQESLYFADRFGADPAYDAPVLENDFAPFKPKCDVLAVGPAVAPSRTPVTDLNVGIRLAGWSKSFSVQGSRIWLRGAWNHTVSDKRPFLRQEIGYDQAFGGIDRYPDDTERDATFELNPCGLGYYPRRKDRTGLPLPNTSEHNREVIDHLGPHRPMAFGPLGRNWLPRRNYAGTYDDAWLESRMPLVPGDFDDRYFQAAPPGQQIPYPVGGEPLEIVHLSEVPWIRTTLPHIQVHITFERRSGRLTPTLGKLDTVLLMPDALRVCLTWRSRLVTERDLFEIASIHVGLRGELRGSGLPASGSAG
jgi:hypothetical protein